MTIIISSHDSVQCWEASAGPLVIGFLLVISDHDDRLLRTAEEE